MITSHLRMHFKAYRSARYALLMLSFISCGDGELSRTQAKNLWFKEHSHVVQYVKSYQDDVIDSLTAKGLFRKVEPGEPLMPANAYLKYLTTFSPDAEGNNNIFSVHYATIVDVKVTGVVNMNSYQADADLVVTLNKTPVGDWWTTRASQLTLTARYMKFDDGWRFNQLHESSQARLGNTADCVSDSWLNNNALWVQHKIGSYQVDYEDRLESLLGSEDYSLLDTAAQVLKDHGAQEKAVSLYKNRVLPAVRRTLNPSAIIEYEEYYRILQRPPL